MVAKKKKKVAKKKVTSKKVATGSGYVHVTVNNYAAKPKKRKRAAKKKAVKKKTEREPEYMVQVSEPRSVRRELLQALRDILLFMQSYEKFHEVQKQKIAHIKDLRELTKELNVLVGSKLRRHLPKGKLLRATQRKPRLVELAEVEEMPMPSPSAVVDPVPAPMPVAAAPVAPVNKELDELEQQLQSIEQQLQGLQ